MEKLLTRIEAAAALKVTLRTIDNYIKRGWLSGLRNPKTDTVRIPLSEIESFFTRNPDDKQKS